MSECNVYESPFFFNSYFSGGKKDIEFNYPKTSKKNGASILKLAFSIIITEPFRKANSHRHCNFPSSKQKKVFDFIRYYDKMLRGFRLADVLRKMQNKFFTHCMSQTHGLFCEYLCSDE